MWLDDIILLTEDDRLMLEKLNSSYAFLARVCTQNKFS
jgi:hypothetical protein